MSELVRTAERALERATRGGAVAAEVALTQVASRTAESAGRIPRLSPTTTRLRGFVNCYGAGGRCGSTYGNARSLNEAVNMVGIALERMGRAEPDPHAGPTRRLDVPTRGMGILDPRLAGLDDDGRREVIEMNDAACAGQPDLRIAGFTYEERIVERVYASSRGFDQEEKSTWFGLSGKLGLRDLPDSDVSIETASRHFADVASVPVSVDLMRRARRMSTRADLPGSWSHLVLEPRVVAKILPVLARAFDADLIAARKSFLSRRAGDPLGAAKLHIIDDASLHGGLETRSFDDRGVPPVAVPLIREGQRGSTYLTPEAARRVDARPTGHVSGDSGIWVGNLVVRPGNRSRNMLFPDFGRFALASDVLDVSGIDVVRGTMVLPLRVFVADNTGVHGYVGVRTLRTDVWTLFGAIVELASDHERHGCVDACTMIVEGIGLD